MNNNGVRDGVHPTHRGVDGQDQNAPHLHRQPTDAVTKTEHLGQRAPPVTVFTTKVSTTSIRFRGSLSFPIEIGIFRSRERWWINNCMRSQIASGQGRRVIEAPGIYMIVGLFPRGHDNPRERVLFADNPNHLFWKLSWAVFCLRGVSGTFLSLKHVKGFRLYKCNAETGLHERTDLDGNGVADLALLEEAYKQWFVPRDMLQAWAQWIHREFNNGSRNVREGKYSLELVLEWSPIRITIVVFFPVLLSLAVGLWLNSKDWTDLATIQTAWGTASYIVTAGGLTAALLGVLGSIPG